MPVLLHELISGLPADGPEWNRFRVVPNYGRPPTPAASAVRRWPDGTVDRVRVIERRLLIGRVVRENPSGTRVLLAKGPFLGVVEELEHLPPPGVS